MNKLNKIVYLGWGSLLWDDIDLPITGKWKKTNFKLPVEYSRISDNGKGRLTLVLDENNGTENMIWYIESRANLNLTINKLKNREKTLKKNIAYINLKQGKIRSTHLSNENINKIKKWAIKLKIDAIVWTDLQSNWDTIKNIPYSKENAFEYYISFKPKSKIRYKIYNYIKCSSEVGKITTDFSIFFLIKKKKKKFKIKNKKNEKYKTKKKRNKKKRNKFIYYIIKKNE
jgi:hypothetical protein